MSGIAQGITQAGSVLGQALGQRMQQSREKQEKQELLAKHQTVLQNTLGSLTPDSSPLEIIKQSSLAIQQGVPPEQVKAIQGFMDPVIKQQLKDESTSNILGQLGIGPQGQTGVGDQEPGIPGTQPIATPGRQPQAQGESPLKDLSDQQLISMKASGIPQAERAADTEIKLRSTRSSDFRSDRDFAFKRAGKFIEKIDDSRAILVDQEDAVRNMDTAINQGNTSFFSKDNFAGFLGKYGEGLRTSKGTQLLNAQKEFLLSNIGRAGARPNQWIEQQISSALTKIGRTDEANLTVVEALKARTSKDRKRIELTDQIVDQYEKDLGYPPANLSSLVEQAMKPYEKEIEDRFAYRTRELYEKEQGDKKIKRSINKPVLYGTPLTPSTAKLFVEKYGDVEKAKKNAKRLGYRIPSMEEYRSYTQ